MRLRRTLLTLALAAAVFGAAASAQTPADRVDPFIGTTNFGTANPGAVTPHGMMSVVPFNVMGSEENVYDKDARWWSTPYEYHNKFFTGFAHGALSGVGCPELGALLTMATTGPLTVDYREYGTSYRDEKASPGYYSVFLDKYGVLAEATATARTSVERYTFPGGEGHILLNLGEGLTNESGAMVRRVSATEIEGTKLLGTFCYNAQKVAEFLEANEKVAWVNYPGLKSSKYYELAQKYMPNGTCGVISFGLKGGRKAAEEMMDKLKLAAIVTHVADSRTSILHPASHTHRQMNDEQLKEAGVAPDLIRLSVGIENVNDIIADLEQAL